MYEAKENHETAVPKLLWGPAFTFLLCTSGCTVNTNEIPPQPQFFGGLGSWFFGCFFFFPPSFQLKSHPNRIQGPNSSPGRPLTTTKHKFHNGNLITAVTNSFSSWVISIHLSSCICLELANMAAFWSREGELALFFSYIFSRNSLRAKLQTR